MSLASPLLRIVFSAGKLRDRFCVSAEMAIVVTFVTCARSALLCCGAASALTAPRMDIRNCRSEDSAPTAAGGMTCPFTPAPTIQAARRRCLPKTSGRSCSRVTLPLVQCSIAGHHFASRSVWADSQYEIVLCPNAGRFMNAAMPSDSATWLPPPCSTASRSARTWAGSPEWSGSRVGAMFLSLVFIGCETISILMRSAMSMLK